MARFAELAPDARAFIVDLNGGIAARIDPGGENDTAVSFVIDDGPSPCHLGNLPECVSATALARDVKSSAAAIRSRTPTETPAPSRHARARSTMRTAA
jgi:hypothetical protein